jgi:hypothetical protein
MMFLLPLRAVLDGQHGDTRGGRGDGLPQGGWLRRLKFASGISAGAVLLWAIPTPVDLWFIGGAALSGLGYLGWPLFRRGRARSPDAPAEPDAPQDGTARPPSLTYSAILASLFLFTFACSGVYMILANYNLVSFTGKNVYFLGLDSASDLLEGLALLAGGLLPIAYRRPDREPST